MSHIKRSHLAGSWYAGDAARLGAQVDDLLNAASDAPAEAPGTKAAPPAAIVVPHAGYLYSGRAAAAAYARLRGGGYGRVVVLAPSHFAAFRGVALLAADAFETPLGLVAIDADGLRAVSDEPLFRTDAEPYEEEHSLEIQLPFLQRTLPAVPVVPALLGSLRGTDYAVVAAALERLREAHTLFVISSDFVHYGWRFDYLPFPPDSAAAVRSGLRQLDLGAVERVCAGDAAGFQQYVAETGATICGRVPLTAFLTLHGQRSRGELLAYYTSLDVTGDYEHSVSYASIAFPNA